VKKSLLVTCLAAIIMMISLLALAEDQAPSCAPSMDKPWSFDLGTTMATKYMGTDGSTYDSHPVVQQDVCLTHNPTGIYFDVWGNKGLHRGDNDSWSDEVDLTVGWSKDNLPAGLVLDTGISVFCLNPVNGGVTFNYFDAYTSLARPIESENLTVTPKIQLDTYLPAEDRGDVGGVLCTISFEQRFKLPYDLTFIDEVSLGLDDGINGLEPNQNVQYKLGLEYPVSDSVALGVAFHQSFFLQSNEDRGRGDTWGEVTLGYSF
jgi:hypothetical protein